MFEFTNDIVDILGNIEAGKCDTIDFYCRVFEFMWGAKLSIIQTERKSPWNWDLNLKSVWAAKTLLLRRTASRLARLDRF